MYLLIIPYFYSLFDKHQKKLHEIVNIYINLLKKQEFCAMIYIDCRVMWQVSKGTPFDTCHFIIYLLCRPEEADIHAIYDKK